LLFGQLGPVGQADGNQFVNGLIKGDKCHLHVRRLNGLNHGRRVEPDQPSQLGAGNAPALARSIDLQTATAQFSADAHYFHFRRPALFLHSGCAPEQLFREPRGVQGSGQFTPSLLHVEIGLRDGEDRVVRRGLELCLACLHHLPRGQRLEDGIAHCKDSGWAGSD